jgi:hypothetical protein
MTENIGSKIENAASRLVDIKQQIDSLNAEKQEIEGWLRDQFRPGQTIEAGDYQVTISRPARRLNTTALANAYPVVSWPDLYTPTLNTTAVKKHLSEKTLEDGGFYTEGAPTVRVK